MLNYVLSRLANIQGLLIRKLNYLVGYDFKTTKFKFFYFELFVYSH